MIFLKISAGYESTEVDLIPWLHVPSMTFDIFGPQH